MDESTDESTLEKLRCLSAGGAKKFVMTSKTRHDVNKFITPWHKRYVMTSKIAPWRSKVSGLSEMPNTILVGLCFKNILSPIWLLYGLSFPSYQWLCLSQFRWPWPLTYSRNITMQVSYPAISSNLSIPKSAVPNYGVWVLIDAPHPVFGLGSPYHQQSRGRWCAWLWFSPPPGSDDPVRFRVCSSQ